MKKIKYSIRILLVVTMTDFHFGCEDYLDLKPYDALTADQLLLDEAGCRAFQRFTENDEGSDGR